MYEDRIIFYIDILGFRSFILSKDHKYEEAIVKSMDNILKISQIFDKNDIKEINVNTSIMSDSIVCSFKIGNSRENFMNMISILMACSAFQVSLLNKGILSRGAIVRGKLNHRNNLVFGEAMIKAYCLERETAIYPRVIIDQEALNFIEQLNENMLKSYISKDNDMLSYVDYISHIEDYSVKRKDIESLIITKIDETYDKVKTKYTWVRERL